MESLSNTINELFNRQHAEEAVANGQFSVALDEYKKSLGSKRQIPLPNDNELLPWLIKTGKAYKEWYDLNDALFFFKEACQAQSLHPDLKNERQLVEILNEIGETNILLGNFQEAQQNLDQCLEKCKALGLEESMEYSKTLENQALLDFHLDKFDSAMENINKSLELCQKLLGEKHIENVNKLRIRGEIGNTSYQFDTPLEDAKKCIEILKENREEEHPDYIQPLQLLGLTVPFKPNKRQEHFQRAMDLTSKFYHPEHFYVAVSLYGLRELGGGENDMEDLQKAYDIALKVFGSNSNPFIATILKTIAKKHKFKDNYEQSNDYLIKALEIDVKFFEKDHGRVLKTCSEIGKNYLELEEYEDCIKYFKKVIEIPRTKGETGGQGVVSAYYDIVRSYKYLKKYKMALKYQKELLNLNMKIHKEPIYCIDTGRIEVINLCRVLRLLKEEIEFEEETLETIRKINGEERDETAQLYYMYGEALAAKRQPEKSLAAFEKNVSITLKLHGKDHWSLSASYHEMGILHERMNYFNKALQCQLESFKVSRKYLKEQEDYVEMSAICESLGRVFYAKCDLSLAKKWYFKALQFGRKGFEEGDQKVLDLSADIDDIQKEEVQLAVNYDNLNSC